MPHIISIPTYKFLRTMVVFCVHEFLDDPDGMCGKDSKLMVATYRQLCLAASDCNHTFWGIAAKQGTDYEITRLKDMLADAGVKITDHARSENDYA